MPLILFAVIAVLIFNALTTDSRNQQIDAPKAVAEAAAEVNEYRIFMFLANQYMSTYSGGPGTVTWSMLTSVPIAPPGAKNVSVPSNWRVVVAPDMTWVACTQMSERAAGMMQQLAVSGGQTLNPTNTGQTNFLVVGSTSDISKSSLCD